MVAPSMSGMSFVGNPATKPLTSPAAVGVPLEVGAAALELALAELLDVDVGAGAGAGEHAANIVTAEIAKIAGKCSRFSRCVPRSRRLG